MQYVILVKRYQHLQTALSFCQACVDRQHTVLQVFFMDKAVWLANSLNIIATDQFDLTNAWKKFATQNNIPFIICSTSSAKYGILSKKQAQYFDKPYHILDPMFTVAGLTECFAACQQADRVITF